MIGDPWEEEPDEPLVEKYQPDEDAVPEPPSPETIPAEVRRTFWALVGTLNVALLATSLGLMLLWFRREWVLGGGLVAVGIAAFLWSYYRYRRFDRRDRNE